MPDAPSLAIRLFGPFEVLREGEPLPRVRQRNGHWLLALLILRGGREVERAWLAGTLWPDLPAERAAAALRSSLSDLRLALGPDARRLLAPTSRTLALDLTGVDVDLVAFDAAVATDDRDALEVAVSLYRGPLLEECREAWAFADRQSREEAYLAALERLAHAATRTGDHSAAERYLRQAIATDPLRESTCRTLMQSLAMRGNYAAALDLYRELRLHLHRELNAAPDPETVGLFARLQDEARTSALPRRKKLLATEDTEDTERRNDREAASYSTYSVLSVSSVAENLPIPPTSLVGREGEIEALGALLRQEDVRMVTLTGPGGVGKTRLGLAVVAGFAAALRDGAALVRLESLRAPDLLPETIASALGLRGSGDRTPIDRLTRVLRAREMVLLLDNFEHLLPAAPVVAELLAAAPSLKIVATSRVRLRLYGEHEFVVPPLSPAAGAALFAQRATAARRDFQARDENRAAIEAICRRLDGLPLAIELAAARVKYHSPGAHLSRLDRRLPLLTGGPRDLPARQQTLRDTITWSYELLSEREQQLFRRLTVFSGGFTSEAAAAVADEVELDVLISLADQSLLRLESDGPNGPRFGMLETVREYALEQLAQRQEGDRCYRRHAEFFLAFAESEPGDDRLAMEHNNLRAALDWAVEQGEGEIGLRLGAELWEYWVNQGHVVEARQRLSCLLLHPKAKSRDRTRARALFAAGKLAVHQGEYPEARQWYQEGLSIYQEINSPEDEWWLRYHLGEIAYALRDHAGARAILNECLAICEQHGNPSLREHPLNVMGEMARVEGDAAGAERLNEECLALARARGAEFPAGMYLSNLGFVALARGDYPRAGKRFAESLRIRQRTTRMHPLLAVCLVGLAGVAMGLGRTQRAAQLLGATDAMLEAIGAVLQTVDRDEQERIGNAVRAALDPPAFDAAWMEGHSIPLEEALAAALQDGNAPD